MDIASVRELAAIVLHITAEHRRASVEVGVCRHITILANSECELLGSSIVDLVQCRDGILTL